MVNGNPPNFNALLSEKKYEFSCHIHFNLEVALFMSRQLTFFFTNWEVHSTSQESKSETPAFEATYPVCLEGPVERK